VPTEAAPTLSAVASTLGMGMRVSGAYNGPMSQRSASEQPMQPWPDWIGKDTPSFQRMVEQALQVVGPLQSIL